MRKKSLWVSALLTLLVCLCIIPVGASANEVDNKYKDYTEEDVIRKGYFFILGQNTSLLQEYSAGRFGIHGTVKLAKGSGIEVMQVKKGYMNFEDEKDKNVKKRTFLQIRDVVENKTFWVEQNGFYAQRVLEQEAYISGYRLYFTYGYNTDVHTKKDTLAYRGYKEFNNDVTFAGANKSEVKKWTNLYYESILYADNDYFVKTTDGNFKLFYLLARDLAPGLAQTDVIEEEPIKDIEEEEPVDNNVEAPLVLQPGVVFISTEKLKKVYTSRSSTRGLINEVELPSNRAYEYVKDLTTLGETTIQIRDVQSSKRYYVYAGDLFSLTTLKLHGEKTDVYDEIQGEKSKVTKKTTAYKTMSSSGKFSDRVTVDAGTEVYIKGYTTSASGQVAYAIIHIGVSETVYYIKATDLSSVDNRQTLNSKTKITTKYIKFNKTYKGYKSVLVRNGGLSKAGATTLDKGVAYQYMSDRETKGVTFIRIKDTRTSQTFYVEKDNLDVTLTDTSK